MPTKRNISEILSFLKNQTSEHMRKNRRRIVSQWRRRKATNVSRSQAPSKYAQNPPFNQVLQKEQQHQKYQKNSDSSHIIKNQASHSKKHQNDDKHTDEDYLYRTEWWKWRRCKIKIEQRNYKLLVIRKELLIFMAKMFKRLMF